MSESEVTYNLMNPFEYAFKGDQRNAEFITLTAPTMRQHSQAAALKQSIIKMVTKAVRDAQSRKPTKKEDEEDEEDEPVTAEMVISTIYGSDCVDANVVWEQAKALFREGVALIDGEQKLTAPLIEKMNPVDFEKLTGEYIANFTLA